MSRRWRHLPPPRRGKYWTGAESSPVPAVPPPPVLRQAGPWPRFAARLLPSRPRRADPGWPQANQGQAWPSFTEPAGSRPRFGARPVTSRGRYSNPPWPQGSQGQPWPSFTRQPLTAYQRGIRLLVSRGRWDSPPWPQGNQGTAWPSFPRQAGTGARFTPAPRGRQFSPPWARAAPPPPPVLRQAGPVRFAARLLPSAPRRADPPWPQANQGQPWPSWIQQPGARPRYLNHRASPQRLRYFEPPWPPPSLRSAVFAAGGPDVRWAAEPPSFRWAAGTARLD